MAIFSKFVEVSRLSPNMTENTFDQDDIAA